MGEQFTRKLAADLPDKALGLIDTVVDTINDRVVRPVILVARGIVFGILIATFLVVAAVGTAIMTLRILDVYAFPTAIWASYLVLAGIFSLIGLILWAKRGATTTE
jgi:hypothetical protein